MNRIWPENALERFSYTEWTRPSWVAMTNDQAQEMVAQGLLEQRTQPVPTGFHGRAAHEYRRTRGGRA